MSEQEPYSIEWHKGFQMGLYSGKTTERERIIKLLEEHQSIGFIDGTVECRCGSTTPYQLHLLALIKGENK